ncbi:complex I subunit 5 family protein [Plastorhodobacter daqingensis]|uniref:Complex I subunit 5 family protein n=1 Tax=Plastorhodobacter daqingensis TaxID=1387281 RepID=A0ABW2UNX3_9RHOB
MTGVAAIVEGPVTPLLVLIWPLLLAVLAALPPLRERALAFLPLAAVPALGLGLQMVVWGPSEPTRVPALLLGTVLAAGREGALLLAMTGALWTAAGVYGTAYLRKTARPAVLTGFWCLTLAGNLGVFLAADVVTFYVAFAAVSLAAYFLVVAEGDDRALRAGRIYLVLAVLGEACLLLGFMIGIAGAGSLAIADLRPVLAEAPLALALLVAGFGVKAGLMPLHVWLPLAHPAAPTPASAVLSGAIVKAGIIGMILFLPPIALLVVLGGITGFAGALLGLTQRHPKAILAYSTISQMGLTIMILGAGGGAAAAFYALHHGLAKGALFLSVGLVAAAGPRWRPAALGLAALAALSVAGVPLTGGALAKSVGKAALGKGAQLALTLSAITTTLVLGWFLLRLRAGTAVTTEATRPGLRLILPVLTMVFAAMAAPWLLWAGWSGLPADYPLRWGIMRDAFWPAAVGIAAGAVALRLGLRPPALPEGDIVVGGERLVIRLRDRFLRGLAGSAAPERPLPRLDPAAAAAARLERALIRWRFSGTALILTLVVLFVALAL